MQIAFWCILMIAMLIFEASTAALLSIWFAGGALCALLCAVLGVSLGVQIAVFFIVSGLLLAFLLPYARRKTAVQKTATNADRIIGAEAIVTEEIDEVQGTGTIRVMGAVWSARSTNGQSVAVGETVTIDSIQGVKAMVSRKA